MLKRRTCVSDGMFHTNDVQKGKVHFATVEDLIVMISIDDSCFEIQG